jgi:hypothetical protein
VKFQVIFQIIDVHDTHHGDAVLFEDEVFTIDMSPADNLPKIDAGFGERHTMNDALHKRDLRVFQIID